jgi:hypothetical protein
MSETPTSYDDMTSEYHAALCELIAEHAAELLLLDDVREQAIALLDDFVQDRLAES